MRSIQTENAPIPVGAYSQALEVTNREIAKGFLFISGQIAIDHTTNEFVVNTSIENQFGTIMKNIISLLEEAYYNIHNVVKVEVFLTDINDFQKIDDIYKQIFSFEPKPARVTIGGLQLPKGANIEVSCTAVK